jgi:hypothetical protein
MNNIEIKTINDAMSWLATANEIKDAETLHRAAEVRKEIIKSLSQIDTYVAGHFKFISARVLSKFE